MPQGTKVECSCGTQFELNSPQEDDHYVWAVRTDGTRSNLGECPITQGSVQNAKNRLINNGHAWFRGGFLYKGQKV
jgi:hypothetical protein